MEGFKRGARWLLFLPAGFAASVLVGFLAGLFFGLRNDAPWWGNLLSGALTAFAFFYVSIVVVPRYSKAVLGIVLLLIGLLSLLSMSSFLIDGERLNGFFGVGMIFGTIFAIQASSDIRVISE